MRRAARRKSRIYLLAQEITEGAEGITLENMAQPQTGCLHDYELTVSDMRLLERADVLLLNGGGMESFLSQAMEQYPQLCIVDTSTGISFLTEEGHEEEHEHEHEHEHGEDNAHIWLSPKRAAQQAENIATALADLDESEAALFAKNAADFRKETDGLLEEAERAGLPQGMPDGDGAWDFYGRVPKPLCAGVGGGNGGNRSAQDSLFPDTCGGQLRGAFGAGGRRARDCSGCADRRDRGELYGANAA